MNYTKTSPCDNCPFRNDIPPYLTTDRVWEIHDSLERGEFPCHKTTVESEGDEGVSVMVDTKTSQHCAGALILMEKSGRSSQMMRIAERLGLYDHRQLDMASPVFDEWEDMAECQER